MSVCGQSGQTEEDSASEEVGAPAARDIYKQKPASKVVRVLTVLAYLLSVSLAAILLSVYYIWVWKSPELPLYNQTEPGYSRHTSNTSGGGDTGVNGNTSIQLPPDNITAGITNDSVTTDATTDANLDVTTLLDTTLDLHSGTANLSSFNDTDSTTSRPPTYKLTNVTNKT